MTGDWHNTVRVIVDYIVLIKLIHVLGGVYIWEFVLNLDFEYSILTGKRKLTWASPIYLGCRWSSLSLVVIQLLGLDTSSKINCQGLVVFTFIFAYLILISASALIALRVAALWEHNRIVIVVAFASWFANIAVYVYSTVTARGSWTGIECVIQNTFHNNISIFSTLATDSILLTLMLIGLFRWKEALPSGGIFQLMYAQGLAWVLVVVFAEVPPAVFTALDLNDPMNLIFQALGLIITSLGASRLYRGLADYPFTNKQPFEAGGLRPQPREPRRSSFGSSQPNYLGDWTLHSRVGGVAYTSLSLGTP